MSSGSKGSAVLYDAKLVKDKTWEEGVVLSVKKGMPAKSFCDSEEVKDACRAGENRSADAEKSSPKTRAKSVNSAFPGVISNSLPGVKSERQYSDEAAVPREFASLASTGTFRYAHMFSAKSAPADDEGTSKVS